MMPVYRMGTATVLAIALLLSTVPAGIWTHLAGVARAQDEQADADTALPGQVIAHGIARLPRGEVAWTVRSIEVPGGEGTPVASFPIGFAIAAGASIAVLDAEGEVLNILADGEAAFLPNGKPGALASLQDDVARLYEVALVSGRDATAGETPGTVVGNPFTAPEGKAFDLEIARASLDRDDQTTIPVSRSGAPVLYLQTAGSTQLQAEGGQTAELAAGQFAVLLGEVMARGTSDEPATFLVAAIGEATAERDATEGTPEARVAREDRQRARNEAAQSAGAPGAERTREKRPKRVRTGGGERGGGGGGQGRQTVPQGTGGTGTAPVTGGVDTTAPAGVPAGTPAVEPTVEATLPAETTVPTEGTPPPEATMPAEDEAPPGATETPEPTAPVDDTAPTEAPTTVEPSPTVEAPSVEETPPTEEVPAEEVPIEEPPVAEVPTEVPPVADEPVTEPTPEA